MSVATMLVVVPPLEIFLPLFLGAAANIPVLPMSFALPPGVIANFVVSPQVVIVVIGIVNAVITCMSGAAGDNHW